MNFIFRMASLRLPGMVRPVTKGGMITPLATRGLLKKNWKKAKIVPKLYLKHDFQTVKRQYFPYPSPTLALHPRKGPPQIMSAPLPPLNSKILVTGLMVRITDNTV